MAISQKLRPRLNSSELGDWPQGLDQKSEDVSPRRLRDARNMVMDEYPGLAIKRRGCRKISELPSNNPAVDGYTFVKSDGSTYLLASDGVNLYATVDPTNQASWSLLKTGLSADNPLEYETAEDKVWMFNGTDWAMSWDGVTLKLYDREKTVTVDNSSIDATHVANPQLTEVDDYWNGQRLVFTSGANQGTVVTVTDFVAATDQITFTPALTGATAVGDRFKVGLIIPKGRYVRFWDARLWITHTPENAAEARFNDLTDPNTGYDIGIDHPLAWPPTLQLDINSQDGDGVWGISPVLRDRIVMMKATGLWRIERDPLTLYRPETFSRAIGSRFTKTWVEKNGLLYFVGQDQDSLPEIYKTDVVNIVRVDPVGGIEPTLRALRQPNESLMTGIIAGKVGWDSGTKSTGIMTTAGRLDIGGIDSEADWLTYVSKQDITINPDGTVSILGIPSWTERYECDQIPTLASPPWSAVYTGNGIAEASAGGTLNINTTYGYFSAGYARKRPSVLYGGKDSYFHAKIKASNTGGGGTSGYGSYNVGLWNGAKVVHVRVNFDISDTNVLAVSLNFGSWISLGLGVPATNFNSFNVLLRADGTYKLWVNGTLIASGTAADTTLNKVQIGVGNTDPTILTSEPGYSAAWLYNELVEFDDVYFCSDLQNGADLGSTLPSSGNIVVQFDYTRAPDALRNLYHVTTLHGGTVGLESWTAGSADFITDTDPAGYVVVANGTTPGSVAKRYHRVRITLTRATYSNGPDVDKLYSGILWLAAPIFIGENIGAWRSYISSLTVPGGTTLYVQIRRATTLNPPLEGDWGVWHTITTGQNIGTILGDATPPISRWIQFKVEAGVSASGDAPYATSLIYQWNNGASVALPFQATLHKKRYMITGSYQDLAKNDIVIVCDRNDAWMLYSGLNLNIMLHFKSMLIGFSSADDAILELDVADLYRDRDSAIDAWMETREENFGRKELRKDLRFGYVRFGENCGQIGLAIKRNTDTDWTTLATLTPPVTDSEIRYNFPQGTLVKQVQRRYRNAELDQQFKISSETIYFNTRGPQP